MGPAIELFLLLMVVIVVSVGAAIFLTRSYWRKAAKKIIDTDRTEQKDLEERARERATEAEARRRAEEELQRTLTGEDLPGRVTGQPRSPVHTQPTDVSRETSPETDKTEGHR